MRDDKMTMLVRFAFFRSEQNVFQGLCNPYKSLVSTGHRFGTLLGVLALAHFQYLCWGAMVRHNQRISQPRLQDWLHEMAKIRQQL